MNQNRVAEIGIGSSARSRKASVAVTPIQGAQLQWLKALERRWNRRGLNRVYRGELPRWYIMSNEVDLMNVPREARIVTVRMASPPTTACKLCRKRVRDAKGHMQENFFDDCFLEIGCEEKRRGLDSDI